MSRYFLAADENRFEIVGDTVLGRRSDCEIVINDSTVSARHAVFIMSEQGVSIQDSQSVNGTYVNGERVWTLRFLSNMDVVHIGNTEFTFVVLQDSRREETPAHSVPDGEEAASMEGVDKTLRDLLLEEFGVSEESSAASPRVNPRSMDPRLPGPASPVTASRPPIPESERATDSFFSPAALGEMSQEDFDVVPVFFATDRAVRVRPRSANGWFTGRRSIGGKTHFGVCGVSIPRDHRCGVVERPRWLKFEFSENPAQHVVIMSLERYKKSAFFDRVREQLLRSSRNESLVFIHGYNVKFDDAIRRTAQISYDLEFEGLSFCYSWPSTGKTAKYLSDANNVAWSAPHLESFLTTLSDDSGGAPIHIIAHSMGNRALVEALQRMSGHGRRIGEVVFAAPDIDAATFQELAKNFKAASKRCTLYASSGDQALAASRKLQGGYPRAGESGSEIVVLDGIDTIDASNVDTSLMGHSYYGDNRAIVSDLYYLIGHDYSPDSRHGLERVARESIHYWKFRT